MLSHNLTIWMWYLSMSCNCQHFRPWLSRSLSHPDMSKDKKTWIRIFQISETRSHKSPESGPTGQTFTIYKVTCTTFPINNPDEAKTVTCWKRFSQFQELYKQLSTVHKQLYLHGQFPENIQIQYFNRRDPDVIEKRREWSLELLEFVASQPILNSHPIFSAFLLDSPAASLPEPCQDHGGESIRDSVSPDPDLLDLDVVISPSISIDTTPVLSPVSVMAESKDHDDTITSSEDNLINIVSEMSLSGKMIYISFSHCNNVP